MADINFGKTVTLKQAAQLIAANPDLRFLLEGEPGIGKSSLIKDVQRLTGCKHAAYIDVPNMDLGDIAMPVVNRDKRITEYFPNSRFMLHTGESVVIMLDEYAKGPDPVKAMLHPMLEKSNPRLGDIPIPLNSYVFLTSNLSSDGVGDSLKAHSRNRLTVVRVRKPNADEWIEWALNNNIAPEVVAWVSRFPHVMASYLDPAQNDNPYIYNPKRPQAAFVTPRSLESASSIVRNRHVLDTDSVIAALTGTVGESAARDMQAYIEFADQLPTWEATIKSPKTTTVPTSPGACAIVVFGAISRIDKDTITPFMEYLDRFEAEWQAVFAVNIAKTPSKQQIAFSCRAFANWVAKNQDLL